MDPLSIVGLVGNIVQFLDFTGTILSTSAHIYSSSRGVLPENADIETVTRHLVLLNNKLKDAASSSGAGELQKLCALCSNVADELLAALDKLKVKGQPGRWKSVKKALQSIWSKNKIEELEQRLARLREELNLHVVVELRDQLALFRAENSDRLRELDIATKHVVDAIVDQRDVFEAAHDAQLTCMKDLHRETLARVKEEHLITRREILHEIRAGLRSESADRQTRRQEACWSVPFVRNPKFVGREQQLDELERRLFVEGSCTKIAIFGLGGVGKTQIALELAYRTRAQRPDCSVFWVPSTTVESFQQAYLDIGRKLCLPQAEKQNDNIKKIVQEYLSQDSAGRWLLIYDNADDLDLWFKNTDGTNEPALINYVPTSSQGSIIFTTRDRKAAVKFAAQNLVGVGEMDEQIATQMLSKSLIDQRLLNDHRTTLDLLEQLTFLPLAIAQAAAYINENGISLSEYLSLLKDKEHRIIEILSEDFEDDGRYRNIKNPIASTWLISFEQIRRRDPLAAEYLSFMACIDPRAVPQSLLPPAKSKKRMIEAIGTLSAYSFITKRPADSSLDLHRLVHLATRNWLQMENSLSKWVAKAIVRLDEVFPSNDHTNRDLWRAYLPHALYVVRSDLGDEVPEKLSLLEKLGLCLLSDGRYNDAEMSFVHVTETRKRVLGEEDLSTLVSMANLALTYCNQGRWTEAEELNKEVLEISKRVLGEEHQETLSIMANLASTYWNQGRWAEAEALEKQVLETSKRVLGEEHPDTLSNMADFASTYWSQGRWAEAEELDKKVVETSKRVLGEEHPSTLSIMGNLASTYWKQGRWTEAEELDKQVLETSKRVLGEEHPSTLITMANLALTWKSLGRNKDAMELMAKCFRLRRARLGPDHPDTVFSHDTLRQWGWRG